MEAYGLYYSYTQYWTHSSKGYLVHGPCFPRYTCLDIRKSTKFRRLSHYLIRCDPGQGYLVHGPFYGSLCSGCTSRGLISIVWKPWSVLQYWTHSSKGYMVHGPCFPRYTCLDIRKSTKFRRLSRYLMRRCVQSTADFHFMEAYGLYYSYTQGYWTTRTPNIGPIAQRTTWYMDHVSHSSKGYMVHGPCFPRYTLSRYTTRTPEKG